MDKHLQWIIPVVILLASLLGELYMMHQRVARLADGYENTIKFEQNIKDRVEVLEDLCCSELGRCSRKEKH